MPVSVLSALTELGVDPWEEAARLATLPKTRAAAALAQLIARLPVNLLARSDSSEITARLVELLPVNHAGNHAVNHAVVAPGPAFFHIPAERRVQLTVWLACLCLGTAALYAFF